MTMSESQPKHKTLSVLLTSLKVVGWVVMAVVLLVVGVSVCAVKMLSPEMLTPLVERAANSALDARVSIGKVELSLQKSYPILRLNVDSVTVISRSIPQDCPARAVMPEWGDTLATFSRLSGEVNVLAFLKGAVDLGNFELHRPQINLLTVNDSVNNYAIFRLRDEAADSAALGDLPDVKLRSFRLIDPRPLRFMNLADTLEVTATIQTVSLTNEDGKLEPTYRIDFASNIDSPIFDFFNLQDLPVSFTGDVVWRADLPYILEIKDMLFGVQELNGKFSTIVDFNDEIVLKTLSLNINPLSVSNMLASISPEAVKKYSIPQGIATDAEIAMTAELTEPYNIAQVGLPRSVVTLNIPPCYFRLGNIDLRRFALSATLTTLGPDLNDAIVEVSRLTVQGPATTLNITCKLSDLATDMLFEGKVNGHVVLDRLPDVLRSRIPGSLAGVVKANAEIKGRPSMFAPHRFHRFHASGDISLEQVRYIAADTNTAALVHHALVHIGTSEKFQGSRVQVDSLLSAKITLDSAEILQSGVKMQIQDLMLSAAVSNRASSADTTSITPLGGRIKTGMFSVFTLTDTAGMRLRNLSGALTMVPLKANPKMPNLFGRLSIDRISVGDNFTRFMISKSSLNVHANPIPNSRARKMRLEVKKIADSIALRHPSMSMDSVFELALERRRSHHGPKRVQLVTDSLDLEVIDWGTSKALRRLLTEWNLEGTLKAERARLFTSSFPVRNRVRNFNLDFNTDTVRLNNVQYKAGHSDFQLSGRISNLRRALVSRRKNQSLKLEFDVLSDTIDVNELANAFFTGAANSRRELKSTSFDDENSLEHDIEQGEIITDMRGPLLIPTNIDAELHVQANNVVYSDLLLHGLRGSVLSYDGALNLHDLSASSEVGAVDLSALYSAPTVDRMQFGFGLKLNKFNISQFLKLVPAVDSMMPLMRDFAGVVSANIAATAPIDREMNISLPRLHAAINIQGDSLTVIDPDTFKKMAKWLFFKDKQKNMIDHMSAEMIVEDGVLQLFPFVFDFDRYRIGVQGSSDLAMNLNYHIAVLKSPLPFKFGINIKGNVDDMKIRLGRARFNEKTGASKVAIVDTTRVNLLREIENVFRRGVRNSRFATLNISERPEAATINLNEDTISRADSLYLIKEGLLPSNLTNN